MQRAFDLIVERLKEKATCDEQRAMKANEAESVSLITGLQAMADRYYIAIEIVNQVASEYGEEVCVWKFVKSVVDGGYIFSSGCNHKRFSDLHSFVYCPYCGKKIKVVE